MSQKAFLVEAVSGKDILGYEPIASQIAEGLHVVSINGFNKDGKSMCAVLLSDEESSGGGGSSSDTLAPPVFSPEDTYHSERPFSDSIEVTITAEDAADIRYNTTGLENNDAWTEYEEPITLTASTAIYAFAVKGTPDDYEVSPIVAAYYHKAQ
jgi:hypothetical protein